MRENPRPVYKMRINTRFPLGSTCEKMRANEGVGRNNNNNNNNKKHHHHHHHPTTTTNNNNNNNHNNHNNQKG